MKDIDFNIANSFIRDNNIANSFIRDNNIANSFIRDNEGQGSVELILIIGGIIVIVLLVASMYKSYLVDLGTEIDSNEINTLNSSFSDISSKFE